MCTVSAPPSLVPVWPWQAPLNWLVFSVVLAIAVVMCGLAMVSVHSQSSTLRRRIGWALVMPGTMCLIVSLFLGLVVADQADTALLTWMGQQDKAMRTQGCPAAWQPTFDRVSQTLQDTRDLSNNLLVVSFILLFPVVLVCPLELDALAAHLPPRRTARVSK